MREQLPGREQESEKSAADALVNFAIALQRAAGFLWENRAGTAPSILTFSLFLLLRGFRSPRARACVYFNASNENELPWQLFALTPRGSKGLTEINCSGSSSIGPGGDYFFFASARVNGGKSAAVRALSIGRRDVDCARD